MNSTLRKFFPTAVALALLAGTTPSRAALMTLTSPDGKWSLSSDEYGAFGEAVSGSFAQRDFGSGLTGYAWTSGVLLSDGANRQWLAGDAGYGFANLSVITNANLISDNTAGSVRTSVFTVPGIAGLQVTLSQSATNAGISQQYLLTNLGQSTMNLSMTSFHDVDLDGATFGNDIVSAAGNVLSVTEGGRFVTFTPSLEGFVGYLAAHVAGGGVTGSLDTIVYDNFGIPAANLNQFRDVNGAAIGADFDLDNNKVSDAAADVGYAFQNNITIPTGGSVVLTFASVPEPGASALALFTAAGLLMRRRRR